MTVQDIIQKDTAILCSTVEEITGIFNLMPPGMSKPRFPPSYYWDKCGDKCCFSFTNGISFGKESFYKKTFGFKILPASKFLAL